MRKFFAFFLLIFVFVAVESGCTNDKSDCWGENCPGDTTTDDDDSGTVIDDDDSGTVTDTF